METIPTIASLRQTLKQARDADKTIAFVPTMGNLHAGHLTLVTEARARADVVVASVFVNPTQFGPGEDFDKYPRTLAEDQTKLEATGCDLLFSPAVDEMYPGDVANWAKVVVTEITEAHCGAARPGHFDGVATVVSKLFNIVQPDIALFGKKDFQQLAVIRRMVTALCFAVEIVGVDTVRESNGLAMSSRNNYLDNASKEQAAILYQTLRWARDEIQQQQLADLSAISAAALKRLATAGLEPEYFNICEALTLQPAQPQDQNLVILTAARLAGVRLIDNIDFQR